VRTGERSQLLATTLWLVAVGLTAWSFGYTQLRASDLWWHLATGRWILEHRSIPIHDVFSFSRAGQPWLQHEWLSDVIFAFWERQFGMPALVYWKWAVIVVTFVVVFWTLRRIARDPLSAFLAVVLAIAVAAPFLDIRPHLYSLLCFALLLHLVLDRSHINLWLLALFLAWANLHGGFLIGLVALPVLLWPALRQERGWGRARPILLGAGCVAVSLANPNGLRALAYPLHYALDFDSPYKHLAEWWPPFKPGGIRAPLFPWAAGAFLAAATFTIASRSFRRERAVPVAGLILGGLTLVMALASRRFIPLFAVSSTLVLAPALAPLVAPLTARVPAAIIPALATCLGAILLARHPLGPSAFRTMTQLDAFPEAACDFMERNRLSGNAFAYYNWGGYLHLRTGGRMKVYIDGRADTVFDRDTYLRYVAVLRRQTEWRAVLDESGADFVFWPTAQGAPMMAELLAAGGWSVLYQDGIATLLRRDR